MSVIPSCSMCLISDSTYVICLEDIPYTHIFIAKIIFKKIFPTQTFSGRLGKQNHRVYLWGVFLLQGSFFNTTKKHNGVGRVIRNTYFQIFPLSCKGKNTIGTFIVD